MTDILALDIEWYKRDTQKKRFWSIVRDSISAEASLSKYHVIQDDIDKIQKLADGCDWFYFIPLEWRDIYSALYDEAQSISVDPTIALKIKKDIHRTFRLFRASESTSGVTGTAYRIKLSEYTASLERVLLASSQGRGYTQGMNFLAAFFLLCFNRNEKKSFVALSYLLKHRYLDILFDPRCSSLLEYMKTLDRKLRIYNKTVYRHLKVNGFLNICYALEWFTTCFIVSSPKSLAPYVIDLLFADVPDILLKLGLSVLSHLENTILRCDQEDLNINFKKMVNSIGPFQVIPKALSINLGYSRSILSVMIENVNQMNPLSPEFVDTLRSPIPKTNEYKRNNISWKRNNSGKHYLSDSSVYDSVVNHKSLKKRALVASSTSINSNGKNVNKLVDKRRKLFRLHSKEVRRKFNMSITERIIDHLDDDKKFFKGSDLEIQLRKYILTEYKIIGKPIKAETSPFRKKSSSSSNLLESTVKRTHSFDRGVSNLVTSFIFDSQSISSSYSINQYLKYRKTLSFFCAGNESKNKLDHNTKSRTHRSKLKNNSLFIVHKKNLMPTPQAESGKFLGLGLITSKSFWMNTFGIKKQVETIEETVELSDDILSDLGYSSGDELSYVFETDDRPDIKHKRKESISQIERKQSSEPSYKSTLSTSFADAIESALPDWFSVKDLADVLTIATPVESPKSEVQQHFNDTGNSDTGKETTSSSQLKQVIEADLSREKRGIQSKRKAVLRPINSTNRSSLKDFYDGTIQSSPMTQSSLDSIGSIDIDVQTALDHLTWNVPDSANFAASTEDLLESDSASDIFSPKRVPGSGGRVRVRRVTRKNNKSL